MDEDIWFTFRLDDNHVANLELYVRKREIRGISPRGDYADVFVFGSWWNTLDLYAQLKADLTLR